MPLEDLISSDRIDDAVEWMLIYRLRQNSHHISPHGCVAVDSDSTRTQELHDDILYLDMQIRTTFTDLRLDMLLHLGSKMADAMSQAGLESVTDEDSSRDSSGPGSHPSVDSHLSSPPGDPLGLRGHGALPSAKEALSHLSDLCSLLEARVNPSLIPVEPGDSDQTRGYPRLTRLMEYLQSLTHSTTSLQFIPIPGSAPTQFLFNITEDPATAGAFVSFSGREQKRPRRKARRRMLQEVELLSRRFFAFNSFVDKLQIPEGYLDNLAKPPIESSTSDESFASFALLQKFRRQTKAACHAIFSQFDLCDRRWSTKHEVRLQLPGWEDVSDYHSTDEKWNLPVQLLLTMCSQGNSWQPARMYLPQYVIPLPRTSDTGARLPSVTDIPSDMSEYSQHTNVCTQGQFCSVLEGCRNKDMDLQFYASEDCEGDGHDGLLIHIPKRPERTRICGDSSPSHMESLWALVQQGYFAKEQNLIQMMHISDKKASIISFDQRKNISIKLILGFMLSMESDHIFECWDPKHIYFLKPMDTQNSPFISISRKEDRLSRSTNLALPRLHPSGNFGEDEDGVKPLPQFAKLAKVLLQIGLGVRLDCVKIPQASERGFRDAWEAFRRTIDECIKRVTCESEADLKTLPFLRAALGCLDFHMKYQQRVKEAPSNQTMEIAWKLVFDTILVQIDNNLTMEKLVKPSAGTTTTQPNQSSIVSFDAKQAERPSTANAFWERLEKFHKSYSRFVADRITESGVESPRRIRIAVLDTGIDFRHPGIMNTKEKGRIKEEWCHSWVGADAKDDDDELHGTNCAYLVHKTAPQADIYVEKVFHKNALGFYEVGNIAKAIEHAANTWDVDIISMPFGLRPPEARDDGNEDEKRLALEKYEELIDGIEDTVRGVSIKSPRLMFAAASNSGKNDPSTFLASYNPWVFCVHASEGNGEDGGINPNPPAGSGFNFMTLGIGLDLMERELIDEGGRKIPRYKKVVTSGTSLATPIAAGIAATVLDLAARVEAINNRTEKKLKRVDGMKKLLMQMSTPMNDARDRLRYMAPWHHWEDGWERDESKRRRVWDTINNLFY